MSRSSEFMYYYMFCKRCARSDKLFIFYNCGHNFCEECLNAELQTSSMDEILADSIKPRYMDYDSFFPNLGPNRVAIFCTDYDTRLLHALHPF